MAVRRIIEIDVDDSRFKAFQEAFQKYFDALKETAPKWKLSERAAEAAKQATLDITGEMEKQQKLQAKMEADRARAERDAKKRLDAIKKTADDIASSLMKGTGELLKWSGIAGVLGSGGMFLGLDALARGFSDTRRSSLQLGVTPGQLTSFKINFGRYINPQGNLENIAAAQADPRLRWTFAAAGVNPEGKNSYQLALELAQRAKAIMGDRPLNERYLYSRGLTQFYSMDELRALQKIRPGELAATIGQTQRGAGALGLTDAQSRIWQNFLVSLQEAGNRLKVILGENLTGLMKGLTDFVESMVKTIATFAKSGKLKEWFDKLGEGLIWLGKTISDPKFQKGMRDFAENIALIAQKIVDALRFLHVIPDSNEANAAASYGNSPEDEKKRIHGVYQFFSRVGFSKNAAAGIAANAEAESGGNPFAWGDDHKAYGIFQWHNDKKSGFRRNAYTDMFGHTMESVKDWHQAYAEQLKFAFWELQHKYGWAYAKLRSNIPGLNSAGWKAQIFSNQYEGPRDKAGEARRRGALAEIIVKIENKTGADVSTTATQAAAVH